MNLVNHKNTGRFNDVLHEWVPCEEVEPAFDWEAFKAGKFAVSLMSEKAINDFLGKCGKLGIVWGSGEPASRWRPERNNFAVVIEETGRLYFSSSDYYSRRGDKIIEWKVG